jgi:hypothetical protein
MSTSYQNIIKAGAIIGGSVVSATAASLTGNVSSSISQIAKDLGKAGNQLGNISSGLDKETVSKKGTDIQLLIGKFFHIKNLIITDVSSDFKSIMSIDNSPMSGECTVSFRTLYAFTANDLEQCFIYSNKGD